MSFFTRKILTLTLCLFCAWAPAYPKYTLVATTKWWHPIASLAEPLKIEVSGIELEDLGQVLKTVRPAVKGLTWFRNATVAAYLASEVKTTDLKEVHRLIRQGFQAGFDNPQIKPAVSFEFFERGPQTVIDVRPDDLEAEIVKFEELNGRRPTAEEIAAFTRNTVPQAQADAEAAFVHIKYPERAKKIVAGFSSFSGAAVGLLSMWHIAGAVDAWTASHLLATAYVLVNSGWTVTAGYYQRTLGALFREHALAIPLYDKFLGALSKEKVDAFVNNHPLYKKALETYQHSSLAQTLKEATANAVIHSMARSLFLQFLEHQTGGDVPMPTLTGDGWDTFKNGLGGGVLYALGQKGAKTLRHGGWITQPSIDVFFQVQSLLFDLPVTVLNANPALRPLRAFFQYPQWSMYLGIFLASLALPHKNRRYLLIDERLIENEKTRKDIDALESIGYTHRLSPTVESVGDLLEQTKGFRRASTRNQCVQLLEWAGIKKRPPIHYHPTTETPDDFE